MDYNPYSLTFWATTSWDILATAEASENWWLEDEVSLREGLFSGAALVSGRVSFGDEIYQKNYPKLEIFDGSPIIFQGPSFFVYSC